MVNVGSINCMHVRACLLSHYAYYHSDVCVGVSMCVCMGAPVSSTYQLQATFACNYFTQLLTL